MVGMEHIGGRKTVGIEHGWGRNMMEMEHGGDGTWLGTEHDGDGTSFTHHYETVVISKTLTRGHCVQRHN